MLLHEGSLEDCPEDDGGVTKFGISLRFYKTLKPDATADDIRAMNIQDAECIYLRKFWEPMRLAEIDDQRLANRLLDLGVNTGMREAALMLQRALAVIGYNIKEDGIIGIQSIAAANGANQAALYEALISEAHLFYTNLAKLGKNKQFLDGWLARLNDTP